MMKKNRFAFILFLLLGLACGAAASSFADDVTCYKMSGDIEYQAGSPFHIVRASSSGKLVSVYYLKLTPAVGDDIKEEIHLGTFTNMQCTIKYSKKPKTFGT